MWNQHKTPAQNFSGIDYLKYLHLINCSIVLINFVRINIKQNHCLMFSGWNSLHNSSDIQLFDPSIVKSNDWIVPQKHNKFFIVSSTQEERKSCVSICCPKETILESILSMDLIKEHFYCPFRSSLTSS